ncbi:FCD domain-containing protein [Isoptericola hypogeus]|uniref:FCD domain-containing protein n=1 Tax=Isoptericola hypogeus TaxID=300179 RepID=A0ABN2J3L4_9MICO
MRTHERVLAHLEDGIAAGRWGLGERLPAERQLAEDLGVSRPSVREAMRILEALGIVRSGVGSGPEAGAIVVDRPAAGLGAAVRLHVATGTLPVRDVVATRVLLESWAVAQAAERVRARAPGAADRVGEARRLLGEMEADDVTSERFLELDQAFHLELVRLAGNVLVEAVMTGLRGAVGGYVASGIERLPSWPRTAARLRTEHRGVLDAVAAGDGDAAASAVRAHIEGFSREAGVSTTRGH